MDDAQLVQRAAERDDAAFALAYSRYAPRLYDFLWWVLQDREEAAQALYDTFLDAGARIHELQDGTKLRPWLFAIAGRIALRRPAADVDAALPPAPGDPSWNELVSAVRSLAGELTPRNRALLDLRFRQGLEGEELADAVGVPPEEAAALVDRLTERVERALSLTAVACLGQKDCAELRALLGAWDGRLDGIQGETVERHAVTCSICGPRRRRRIAATALFGVSPAPAIPSGVREHVLADVELASHRALPWSIRRDGFPRGAVVHAARRWQAAIAVVAAAVVLIAGVLVATRDGDGPEEVASVDTTVARPTTTLRPTTTASSSSTSTSTSTSVAPGDGQGGTGPGGSTATTRRASSGGAPTGGGGSGGGGGGGGGGTTTPPNGGGSGGDPDPPPTDPPPTTTTAPPDTTGPSLSGLSISPSVLRASGGCTNGNPTQASVSIQASDPSGIARVTATVAAPGGGSFGMTASGGGTYTTTVGPFENSLPAPYELDVPVVVQATDGAGNSQAATGTLVLRCSV